MFQASGRIIATLSILLATQVAGAAEITRVLDAFQPDKVWDGLLGVRFVHHSNSALILREWICQKSDAIDVNLGANPNCPNGNRVVDSRQLAFNESINVLNLDLRVGLYTNMEFYATLPIVVGWQSELTHDTGVTGGNSLVDSPLTPSLFEVPYSSGSRAGVGDMTLGFKIAPFHADQDPMLPSWVLGVEYLAPTGSTRSAGGSGVGAGIHEIKLFTAISRPLASWFEPYFGMGGTIRFPGADSPFQNERITQTLVSPGHSLGLQLGGEFYPWRQPSKTGQYVAVDLGLTADFTFEGREYTELFDSLGSSDCDPSNGCGRTRLTRGERVDDAGNVVAVGTPGSRPRKTNGVTDVEQYGVFGLNVGMTYQALRYLRIRAGFQYARTTSHFITFADAGKDLDRANNVEKANSENLNEYNPVYNETYDELGKRFRVDEKNSFGVTISIEGQF